MIFNDRIMKRIIYSLLLSLCGLVGMAQTGELMRIYLDKECYLAKSGKPVSVDVTLPAAGLIVIE